MVVDAGTQITLNPGDQNTINQAISQVAQAGGGTVFLSAGAYDLTGPVYIKSNVVLTGDKNAILRVSQSSSQWFVGQIGIISSGDEDLKNSTISNIQIDGNCHSLPSGYANSPGHARDCERAFLGGGSSGDYGQSVKIYGMQIYDCFSDGIYIRYTDTALIYDNFISNCEHEGIYCSVVRNSLVTGNRIAAIGTDGIRLDNCIRCKVSNNYIFSYTGGNSGSVPLDSENGIQVGDAGSSKGYDARKSIHTQNIEITNNTLVNIKAGAFSPYNGYDGVYVHNNTVIGGKALETSGIPVNISDNGFTGIVDNVSESNPPTKEMSEKVFSSIFDILNLNFGFQYLNLEIPINATAEIVDYNNTYNPHSLVFVNETGFSSVTYSYDGKSVTHYISEDIWEGDLPNDGKSIYLQGDFNKSKLKITVFTPKGFGRITKFNVTEEKDQSGLILNPNLWGFVGTLSILGISIFRNLRRVIRW